MSSAIADIGRLRIRKIITEIRWEISQSIGHGNSRINIAETEQLFQQSNTIDLFTIQFIRRYALRVSVQN